MRQSLRSAIKGGTDTTVYDYTGLQYGAPAPVRDRVGSPTDGNLHAPASKYPSSRKNGVENPSQWYGISQLTVCYRVLAPISGTVFNDANGSGSPTGQAGIGPLNVTIDDKATRGQTTVQAGGRRDILVAAADRRLLHGLRPRRPGTAITRRFPRKTRAVALTRGDTRSPSSAWAARREATSASSLSAPSPGRVYNDSSNENGTYDSGEAQAWTVNLYKGTGTTPVATTTSSSSDGLYTLKAQLENGTDYTVCEIPGDSNVWAQGIPDPTSDDVCKNLDGLRKGHVVTGTGAAQTIPSEDFANVQAEACPDPSKAEDGRSGHHLRGEHRLQGDSDVRLEHGQPGRQALRAALGGRRQTLGDPDAARSRRSPGRTTASLQNQVTLVYNGRLPVHRREVRHAAVQA